MASIVSATEAQGMWMLEASMFPESVASIRAHERVGFRVVGTVSASVGSTTVAGGTRFSWNAVAPSPGWTDHQRLPRAARA